MYKNVVKDLYILSRFKFSTFLLSSTCSHDSSKMPKPGFYAVRIGKVPGIYMTWAECEAQVKGFPNASFKKFSDLDSAQNFVGFNTKPIVSISTSGYIGPEYTKSSINTSNNRPSNKKQKIIPSVSSTVLERLAMEPQPSTSFNNILCNNTKPIASISASSYLGSRSTKTPIITLNNEHSNKKQMTIPSIFEAVLESKAMEPQPSTSFDNMDFAFLDEPFEFDDPLEIVYETSRRTREVYYAVHRGAHPGVYRTWTECEAQIKNTRNASYRKFDNEEQALEYVQTGGITKATKREIRDIKYNNRVIKSGRGRNRKYVLQNPDEPVVIFTDGASAKNGRKQARAGIGVYWGPNHPLNTSKRLPGRQTNNRAEIYAAVHALNQAKEVGAKKIRLYTDSQFLIHAITDWVKKWKRNGWKLVTGEPVVNKNDFLELEAVSEGLDVEWVYVKAHARNHGNDQADKLAVAGARLLLEPDNCSTYPKPQLIPDNIEPFILTHEPVSAEEILPLIIPEEDIERKTFYAVHRGKVPGVYKTWTECEEQIKDCIKPWFKKFSNENEAKEFVKSGKTTKNINIPDHGPDMFITVFTDGASSCNGQDGAKAGLGVYWGPGNELNTSMRLPGRQTNNRAEIHACVHALKQAKQLGINNVRLYTDSQFVIKGITTWIEKWKQNDWKLASGKSVVNKEDFIVLDDARQGLNVDWCYVKGHDNNPGNVEADKLAVAGCSKELSQTLILA